MREEIDLINLGDVEVYLEDVGPEEAPVMVVLHGGPGGSSYALREGLGEYLEDFRVLYLDQRGGGRSPELELDNRLFTVDALVTDLEQLRHTLGLDSWTLLGHGFGAVLALEYARRSPQSADGLILINPWTNFPWLAGQLYKAALVLRGMRAEAVEVELPDNPEGLLAEVFAQTEPKAAFDALMFPNPHSRMEFEWMVEGSQIVGADGPGQVFVENGLWRLDYTPFLPQLRVPAAVIVGELDGTSYPEAQSVADALEGDLELIPGAGHYPWIDEPYAFAEALERSLGEMA
ncbi:MAG: alpha/beta hydrolase [Meiothermus sp.]|nr:alpha/beta hydrolase [Meiothermus sp.]